MLKRPGAKEATHEVLCRQCGTLNKYHGFHSPLGRHDPRLLQDNGTTGIFLPVKGPSLVDSAIGRLAREEEAMKSGCAPTKKLAALSASSPVMDLNADLKPL